MIEKVRDESRILLKNADFDVKVGPPALRAEFGRSEASLEETRYWIVKMDGPVPSQSRLGLEDRGVQFLSYIPNGAYLVRVDPDVARTLPADERVSWVGPWRPDYKIEAGIGTRTFSDDRPAGDGQSLLIVHAFDGEDLDRIADETRALGLDVMGQNDERERLLVRADHGSEVMLATLEGIEWIEEAPELTRRNNTTRWVAQTNQSNNTRIWDEGLRGEGQIIGHIDGPIRESSCYFNDSVAIGPNHRKIVGYRGTLGSGSHGTHTAATAAGLNESGSLNNAGIAYEAKLSHTRDSLVTGFGNGPSNLYGYLEDANTDGAHIHTNSWGDDGRTTYTTWCHDIDEYMRDYEDDLVIFAVTNTGSLRTPENAKNVLAVGGTLQAPNQGNHCTGGDGPTDDGRRKPEIYLPGCSIVSASTGSCGTTSSSGTSMACPAVAGSAALVRQYYTEGFYPTGAANAPDALSPTGALLKATLLNGTVDMAGVVGYPSNREGWGRLNLDNALYFAGDARTTVVKDVRHASGLSTGGADEYLIDATNTNSLKVTLVFTDFESSVGALAAPVNDLDLEVEGPDGLFLGNVFTAGSSTTGGSADPINNVERVILSSGGFTDGTWTVRVRGAAVNSGTQGYALHISGNVAENNGAVDVAVVNGRVPSQVSLAQNRPNPFDASTSMRFALPTRNEVSLSVFDITGRRVQSLLEGTFEAGEYTVDWDGRDFEGAKVAAGIYFYRLEGENFEQTRKMVVLR